MKRNSYDTAIKHLVRLGLVDAIPSELYALLSSSNISRWKNEDESKYFGSGLNSLNQAANEKYDLFYKVAQSERLQRNLECYFKLVKVFQSAIVLSSTCQKILYDSHSDIVDAIQEVKPILGLTKAVSFLGFSTTTFHNWMLETKVKCVHSYFEVCNRIRPNQLSRDEVNTLRDLITSDEFKCWPISSIAFHAQREKILSVGLSTFYKYAKLLGISRPRFKKPKHKTGLLASAPNEKWHMDITKFKILGKEYSIYIIMDNFSRYILNWGVHHSVSGEFMRDLLKEAISQFTPKNAQLIADGGSENNNIYVDELLTKNPNTLTKLIAQKDISFSNSMVEAINKILKYNYLFPFGITSLQFLLQQLEFAINDYNNKRPHFSLKGSTPFEVFNNTPWDRSVIANQFELARLDRLEINRKNTCDGCQ
jgi:putative transposase